MRMVAMTGSYDYRLVALSVLIAVFASYVALELAARVSSMRRWTRLIWLIGGATAMGAGIWSMHYIGMLAYRLPVRIAYHIPTVVESLVAAILAAFVALFVVSRRVVGWGSIVVGGVLMGIGIATMHFTGMNAMRMTAMHAYNHVLLLLSVLLAVAVSMAALWLTSHYRDERRNIAKVGISIVMGLAIVSMHYTGMAAVAFMPMAQPADMSHAADISTLVNGAVILFAILLLCLVLLTSLIDRRFSAQSSELAFSELRYEQLFDASPGPMFVFELRTLAILAVNQAAIIQYGFSKEDFQALTISDIYPSNDLSGLLQSQPSSSTEAHHQRKDGSVLEVELSLRIVSWKGKSAALLLANDITKSKRLERRQAERRLFLETVARNHPLSSSLHHLVNLLTDKVPGGSFCVVLADQTGNCHIKGGTLEGHDLPPGIDGLKVAHVLHVFGMDPLHPVDTVFSAFPKDEGNTLWQAGLFLH